MHVAWLASCVWGHGAQAENEAVPKAVGDIRIHDVLHVALANRLISKVNVYPRVVPCQMQRRSRLNQVPYRDIFYRPFMTYSCNIHRRNMRDCLIYMQPW